MSAAPSLAGSARVTLGLRTTSVLNGSQGFSRGAVMAAARRRKTHRTEAAHVVGLHLRACRVSLPVVVTLTRLAPSSGLDDDNIRGALKSVRDGVADALGVNDRDPRVAWVYDQRRTKRNSLTAWGVEVLVESRAT